MKHEKITIAITQIEEAKKALAVRREACLDIIRNILMEKGTVSAELGQESQVNEELVDVLAEVSFPVCFHASGDGRPTNGVIQLVDWDEDFETAAVSGLTIDGQNPFTCHIESIEDPENVLLFLGKFNL